MERLRGGGSKGEKRGPPEEWQQAKGQLVEESSSSAAAAKRARVPALAGVIREALKMDSLQRLSSTLEPLLRRIVSEEVERALTKMGQDKPTRRSSPQRIEGPGGRRLQLQFRTMLPPQLFTGGKVEGERGAAIHVALLDANTGMVVPSGPESTIKLDVVVLEGDFNDEVDEDWSEEQFESFEVKEREGKRPLLTGDLHITLKAGIGTLGEVIFTDNSSWIRSRKFRLGVKVADGYCDGIRVREAKTEAFAVKDHRGELYKKHYPPALHDEVWRLEKIAKDGALHKKLISAAIFTVEDFLRLLVRDAQRLRSILGSAMSNKMWEITVDHAKTCVLGGKLYVYYSDHTQSTGAVFNHIYELRGLIANNQFVSVESLSHDQKGFVDLLVKRAYDDWNNVVEYDNQSLVSSVNPTQQARLLPCSVDDHSTMANNLMATAHIQSTSIQNNPSARVAVATPQASDAGPGRLSGKWSNTQEGQHFDDYILEEEIRTQSSEILEHDDMQHLLRSLAAGEIGGFDISTEPFYSFPDAPFEPQGACGYGQERNRGSAKAVVSWLKLKAAFRWGIFVRKKAAEKRAQLVELD